MFAARLPFLSDVLELAKPLEAAFASNLDAIRATGVPMNDRHPLTATLEATDAELRDVRQEAAQKDAALRATQQKIADAQKNGQSIGSDHPLFTELDEAGKSYDALGDKIGELEQVKS